MKKIHLSFSIEMLTLCIQAIGAVVVTTVVLLLIGRDTLGEAGIALLYLVPVGWVAARQGQGPGLVAAGLAGLLFDFFFIPPFYTFAIGRLESWLVLAIFLTVAIVIVGRIQSVLLAARNGERDAILMYELSSALAGLRTQDAVAHTLARHVQQMFQAALVKVIVYQQDHSLPLVVNLPADANADSEPERVYPILATRGLVGEIQLWRGEYSLVLPPEDSRLAQKLAFQAALAIERAQPVNAEGRAQAFARANARWN